MKFNNTVLNHYRAKNNQIFKKAQDQLIDTPWSLGNTSLDNILPTDIIKPEDLPDSLELSEGAKLMLRSNIHITKGLVNGAIRFVTNIIWPTFRRNQLYATAIPSVRINFSKDGVHVIKLIAVQFLDK